MDFVVNSNSVKMRYMTKPAGIVHFDYFSEKFTDFILKNMTSYLLFSIPKIPN